MPDPTLRHQLGLVGVLARKNYKAKYKGAVLGMLWAVVQPAIQAFVLAFVVFRVFRITNIPDFGVFVLCGVLPYSFFMSSVRMATTSVVENASLVKKVAVPKIVFPVAAVAALTVFFGATLAVLLTAGLVVGGLSSWTAPLLLLGVALAIFVALSLGLLAAAFYVRYRDVLYLIESLQVVLFYASPVFYPSERLGPVLASWQRLNPLTGIISVFRGAILDVPVDWLAVGISAAAGGVLFAVGLRSFLARARTFADLT